jgi:hypothetical protein
MSGGTRRQARRLGDSCRRTRAARHLCLKRSQDLRQGCLGDLESRRWRCLGGTCRGERLSVCLPPKGRPGLSRRSLRRDRDLRRRQVCRFFRSLDVSRCWIREGHQNTGQDLLTRLSPRRRSGAHRTSWRSRLARRGRSCTCRGASCSGRLLWRGRRSPSRDVLRRYPDLWRRRVSRLFMSLDVSRLWIREGHQNTGQDLLRRPPPRRRSGVHCALWLPCQAGCGRASLLSGAARHLRHRIEGKARAALGIRRTFALAGQEGRG